jgi:hypothetical protein
VAESTTLIPGNVRNAARLMYAGAVLGAIGMIYYGFAASPSTTPQIWHVGNPNSSAYAAGYKAGAVIAAGVVSGVWLWMAWEVRRGRNWARILSAVLLGVGAFGLLDRLVFFLVSVVTLSWALSWLAGLGAVILLFQRSGSAHFARGDWPPQAQTYPGGPGLQSDPGAAIQTGYGSPQQSGQAPAYPWHDQGQWTHASVSAPGSTRSGTDPLQPKRRHNGLIIGASAAAAIVIIVVGLLAATGHLGSGASRTQTDSSTSHSAEVHTLTLPRTAAGYTRMTGNVGKRLVATVRKRAKKQAANGAGSWVGAYEVAPIGFYAKAGASPLVFIGFSVGTTPQIAPILRSQGPAHRLDSFLLGAGVSSTKDFPKGPLGGVLRCGQSRSGSILCAWADRSVLVVIAEADTTASKLAPVALAFRNAAEH